jgi:hypothetical protein
MIPVSVLLVLTGSSWITLDGIRLTGDGDGEWNLHVVGGLGGLFDCIKESTIICRNINLSIFHSSSGQALSSSAVDVLENFPSYHPFVFCFCNALYHGFDESARAKVFLNTQQSAHSTMLTVPYTARSYPHFLSFTLHQFFI